MKINYVRAIRRSDSPLTCTGTVVHAGTRTATAEGRIVDAQGKLFEHVAPSVVHITGKRGTGTGFFVSSDGLILTNAHVVGSSEEVQVQFADDRTVTGEVRGVDTSSDLAVVRILDEPVPEVERDEHERDPLDRVEDVEQVERHFRGWRGGIDALEAGRHAGDLAAAQPAGHVLVAEEQLFVDRRGDVHHQQVEERKAAAALVPVIAQPPPRCLLDLLQLPLQLPRGAHQRVHVLDRPPLRVLHGGGLGDRGQSSLAQPAQRHVTEGRDPPTLSGDRGEDVGELDRCVETADRDDLRDDEAEQHREAEARELERSETVGNRVMNYLREDVWHRVVEFRPRPGREWPGSRMR